MKRSNILTWFNNYILKDLLKRRAIVRQNSITLLNALGMTQEQLEDTKDFRVRCDDYDVVSESRCFDPWITVLEIVPRGCDTFNGKGCPWYVKPEGTCTTNIVPKAILNEVVNAISYTKDQINKR